MVGMKKRVKAMGGGAMKKRVEKEVAAHLKVDNAKLDKNKDGKIDAKDFAMMKKKKKKREVKLWVAVL